MSAEKAKRYPNPEVECPKCSVAISGTTKLRVKHRAPSSNVADWKILERFYRCRCSAGGFWHEIAAKGVE